MSETSRPGVDFAPASEANLPSVTMNMLIDFLSQNETLYQPPSVRRSFHWLAAVSHENVSCAVPANVADAHLLFVCSEGEAAALLREKPTAFALALVGEEHEGQLPPPCAKPWSASPTASCACGSRTGSPISSSSCSRTSRSFLSGKTNSTA